MKFPIAIRRTVAAVGKAFGLMAPVTSSGNWWPLVREPYTGAWQKNEEIIVDTVMEAPALFACVTLIAGDIAKLKTRLVELQSWGGWIATSVPAFSPVIQKPNRYQNQIQFKEQWFLSKLTRGNTYALKQRDARGVVVALYVLDPLRVIPLVAPDGSIFYQLNGDNLTGLEQGITVPASEIIHDRWNTFFHPLVGLSPIYAAGLPALQSLKIGWHWSKFFGNNAQPGGILAAPGAISPANAKEIKDTWNANYTGINAGKVAVIGDGMKYQALSPTALDSQVIQQLEWGAETIAGVFHVPAYKINVGPMPTNNNVEALDAQYYTQCLQRLIEEFECCMDEGLGLDTPTGGRMLGVDLDLSGLSRMDTGAKVIAAANAIKAGFMAPNEARLQFDLAPVAGGDLPYLQQQNFSLEALAARDDLENPFVIDKPTTNPTPSADGPAAVADPSSQVDAQAAEKQMRELIETVRKGLEIA